MTRLQAESILEGADGAMLEAVENGAVFMRFPICRLLRSHSPLRGTRPPGLGRRET